MIPVQLSLPTIDLTQLCPVCKQPAPILGQVYPVRPFAVCRQCTERLAISTDVFTQDADGDIRLRDTIDNADMWVERARVMVVIALLKRFAGGCVLTVDDIADDMHLPCGNRPRCRKCKNEALYTTNIKAQSRTHIAQRDTFIPRMMEFPLCFRCGQIHGRVYEHNGLPATYCQRCDDELGVEALYRNRAIFEGADAEAIMDRLWNVKQDLFERGVLPDYWYVLMMREEQGQ